MNVGPHGNPIPSTKPTAIFRVLSRGFHGREEYYDLTGVPWKEQNAFTEEIEAQGAVVQQIMLLDPMPVLVAKQIREQMEAETEAQK